MKGSYQMAFQTTEGDHTAGAAQGYSPAANRKLEVKGSGSSGGGRKGARGPTNAVVEIVGKSKIAQEGEGSGETSVTEETASGTMDAKHWVEPKG